MSSRHPSGPRTAARAALATVLLLAAAGGAGELAAQPVTATSVPGAITTMHGVPATYWIAQTSGAGVPLSWRILSVIGPPGLTVTTSGGNATTSGGPATPFEPWVSPGANLITAVSTFDLPRRIETWLITVEIFDPPFTTTTLSQLTVSHDTVIPFPAPPRPKGPGNTWNMECFPHRSNAPIIPHGGVGVLWLLPRPGLPLPPNGTGVTFRGAHPNLGPRNPGTVTAAPFFVNNGIAPILVFCDPIHPDGFVRWILYFKIQSNDPKRVELEKCVVICDHTGGGGGLADLIKALEDIALWLMEEAGAAEEVINSLLSKLEQAQKMLAAERPGPAGEALSAFSSQIESLAGKKVPAASAELALTLAEQLQAALGGL